MLTITIPENKHQQSSPLSGIDIESIQKQFPLDIDEQTALAQQSSADQQFPFSKRLSRRTFLVGYAAVSGVALGAAAFGGWELVNVIHPDNWLAANWLYTYRGHSDRIFDISWSPDGSSIASASADGTVQVWNTQKGLLYTYRGHKDHVTCVAWSPDGKYIASGSDDNTVQVWVPFRNTPVFIYRGHRGNIHSVSWSPDRTRHMIVSTSNDQTAQIWSVDNKHLIHTYRDPNPRYIWKAVWSPNGKYIASGGSDTILHVWNPMDGKIITNYIQHTNLVGGVAWSPTSTRVASCDDGGVLDICDLVSNGGDLGSNKLNRYTSEGFTIGPISWSHDGRYIVSGGSDDIARVHDATLKDLPVISHYNNSIGAPQGITVAWSPDSKLVASGGGNSIVQVWRPRLP